MCNHIKVLTKNEISSEYFLHGRSPVHPFERSREKSPLCGELEGLIIRVLDKDEEDKRHCCQFHLHLACPADLDFLSKIESELSYYENEINEGNETDQRAIRGLRSWIDELKKDYEKKIIVANEDIATLKEMDNFSSEELWDWLKKHKGKDYTITDDDRAFAAKYERMIDDYDKMSDKAKAIYRIDVNKVKELLKGIRSKIYWFGKYHGTKPKKDISSLISDFSPNS